MLGQRKYICLRILVPVVTFWHGASFATDAAATGGAEASSLPPGHLATPNTTNTKALVADTRSMLRTLLDLEAKRAEDNVANRVVQSLAQERLRVLEIVLCEDEYVDSIPLGAAASAADAERCLSLLAEQDVARKAKLVDAMANVARAEAVTQVSSRRYNAAKIHADAQIDAADEKIRRLKRQIMASKGSGPQGQTDDLNRVDQLIVEVNRVRNAIQQIRRGSGNGE